MSHRQRGIDVDRALQLGLGRWFEPETNHHLRSHEVRRGGLGRNTEGDGKDRARAIRLTRLDVGLAEHVSEFRIAGRPLPGFLEERNRFGKMSGQELAQPENLHRLTPLDRARGQLRNDRHQLLDRTSVVVGVVVRDPKEVRHFDRTLVRERLQLLDGSLRLIVSDEIPGFRERRVAGTRRFLRSQPMTPR